MATSVEIRHYSQGRQAFEVHGQGEPVVVTHRYITDEQARAMLERSRQMVTAGGAAACKVVAARPVPTLADAERFGTFSDGWGSAR